MAVCFASQAISDMNRFYSSHLNRYDGYIAVVARLQPLHEENLQGVVLTFVLEFSRISRSSGALTVTPRSWLLLLFLVQLGVAVQELSTLIQQLSQECTAFTPMEDCKNVKISLWQALRDRVSTIRYKLYIHLFWMVYIHNVTYLNTENKHADIIIIL